MISDDRQPHYCHATRCKIIVSPRLLMCKKHWKMVPESLQKDVYSSYRIGQEIDKRPSKQYLKIAREVIEFVDTLMPRKHHNDTTLSLFPSESPS